MVITTDFTAHSEPRTAWAKVLERILKNTGTIIILYFYTSILKVRELHRVNKNNSINFKNVTRSLSPADCFLAVFRQILVGIATFMEFSISFSINNVF